MSKRKPATAKPAPTRREMTARMSFRVELAAAAAAGVTVDAEKGLISNVAVLTAGVARPANSFAFKVDAVTLQNVVDAVNNADTPIRVRLTHPELDWARSGDGLPFMMGTLVNARLDGDVTRADVQLGKFAKSSPQGDMWTFLCDIAQEQPQLLGMSIVIDQGYYDDAGPDGFPIGRIVKLFATDFVGEPGGNPNGLLSRARDGSPAAAAAPPSPAGRIEVQDMTKKQREFLAKLGLAAGADDAATAAFIDTLSDDNKADFAEAATAEAPATESAAAPAADPAVLSKAAADRAVLAAENARIAGISEMAMLAGKDGAWSHEQISSKRSLKDVKAALAKERTTHNAPVGSHVGVGSDRKLEADRASFRDVVALRAGVKLEKPHELALKMKSLSMVDIGRRFLMAHGVPGAEFMAGPKLARLLFGGGAAMREALTAGDYSSALGTFTGIIGDTANRSLQQGRGKYKPKWVKFCNRVTIRDFRQADRAALGFGAVTTTARGDQVAYAAFGDKRELFTLTKKTMGTAFAWEDFINDDLKAIGSVPDNMGFAFSQAEDAGAFGVITANAALVDTVALFSAATHANLTASGTALTSTAWGIARQTMMAQTEAGGAYPLNLTPTIALCPSGKAGLFRQTLLNPLDPGSNGAVGNNPWFGDVKDVVDSAELQANSATAWYAAVAAGEPGCSLEMAFLEGEEEPVIDAEEDFDSYVVKLRGRHVFIAGAIDWRGLYKNAGA